MTALLLALALTQAVPAPVNPPAPPAVQPAPPPQPVVIPSPAPVPLPQSWIGWGGAYNAYATPNISLWGSYAKLMSQSAQVYSFSTYDVTSAQRHPFTVQTSARTGLATIIKQIGPIYVFALADAGAAAAGSSAGFAGSVGSMAIWRIGKTSWTAEAGFRYLNSHVTAGGDVQRIWEAGLGRTF